MIQILIGIAALLFFLYVFGGIVFFLFEFIFSNFLYVIIGAVVIGWIFSSEKK